MTKHHYLRLLGLAWLGPLLVTPAVAQDVPVSPYFYGGLSVGQSRAKIDTDGINASLLGGGLTTTAMSRDERDSGYKIFGGYQFNRYFGLEAGYFNLGKFGFVSTTVPAGSLSGRIKLDGLNLDLVASLPLGERWTVLGRVGAQHARARDTFVGTGAVTVLNPSPSERDTQLKLGAGLQYALSSKVLLRAEAERYRVGDAVGNRGEINLVSLSLVFPLGRSSAPAPRTAYVPPPYVAPAPEPIMAAAPAVVPAPLPPQPLPPERRRVNFSADSLFSFDSAEILPKGRAALDQLASELVSTRFDLVLVEGHTDRLGSNVYNQRLSEQRAEAVKAYLISSGRLDGAKISAKGLGETSPATQAGDCKGTAKTPKLIACLQPDRRVVVEVSGTR
ncbi:OmpA family protein [Paucibacter sp. O1-1]|nr:OmpA family protein [Paucibacter sp. O1-1]MDA3828126.1 OmpA family protein [Paucibacter sp. O1-1]